MNNKSTNAQGAGPAPAGKPRLALPLLALGFALLPVLILFLSSFVDVFLPFLSLFTVLSPMVGIVLAVFALSSGKAVIGTAGKVIAITAIALPLAVIALILLLFIGAATGVISLM